MRGSALGQLLALRLCLAGEIPEEHVFVCVCDCVCLSRVQPSLDESGDSIPLFAVFPFQKPKSRSPVSARDKLAKQTTIHVRVINYVPF